MLLNVDRAGATMDVHGLDALVVSIEPNLRYLSDFGGTGHTLETFAILPRAQSIQPTLIIGHRAVVILAANPTWMSNIVTYEQPAYSNIFPQPGEVHDYLLPIDTDIDREIGTLLNTATKSGTDKPIDALSRTLQELGLANACVGFDDMFLANRIQNDLLPNLQTLPIVETMQSIRLVKTDEELDNIRIASTINQQALLETFAVAGAGMGMVDITEVFRRAVSSKGAKPAKQGFLAGPCEGVVWEQLNRILIKGDIIPSGGLTSYNGYHSDVGRSIVIGPHTPEQKKTHDIVEEAFKTVHSNISPGVSTSDLFQAVETGVGKAGGDTNNLGIYCHSIGLELLELPHPKRHDPARQGFILEPGVTFCIYVMYRSPLTGELLSAEEQYIVTKSGCESLCSLPISLIEVG